MQCYVEIFEQGRREKIPENWVISCVVVVDRVQNLSGSGWLANQRFGFGFIGFQRLVNFRVYRVFGFENVPRIFNFFTIFWSKIFRFGKCSAIFTTNFQISVKIITFQYILVKKSLCRFFSPKNQSQNWVIFIIFIHFSNPRV